MQTSLHSPIVLLSLLLSPCSLPLSHHQVPGDEPPMIIQKREPINQQHRNQQCRDREKKAHNLPRVPRVQSLLSSQPKQSLLFNQKKKKRKKRVSSSCPTLLSEWMYFSLHHECVKRGSLSAPSPAYCDLWAQAHYCSGDMY